MEVNIIFDHFTSVLCSSVTVTCYRILIIMEDLHRELLRKRQKYLQENVIMEEGLALALQEKGVFTQSMVSSIMVRAK